VGAVAGLAMAGCGSEGPQLQPVKGKVLYQQQPVAGAQVVFQPAGTAGESNPLTPSGMTGPDGSFTLSTHPYGEGAVAGDYVVLVSAYGENAREEANPKSRLPVKYSNPAAGLLKVTVKEGNNELPPFDLKP
jgi:hypothetical protein